MAEEYRHYRLMYLNMGYLAEAGHKGKDYKKTRTILSRVGNTTVMTFKGA